MSRFLFLLGSTRGTFRSLAFVIDFDAAKRINPIDSGDAKGQVDAKYDLATKHLALTIASTDAAGSS